MVLNLVLKSLLKMLNGVVHACNLSAGECTEEMPQACWFIKSIEILLDLNSGAPWSPNTKVRAIREETQC